jgi:cytochrome o ubiquinol oxidase operon protein cyoD
MSKIVSSHHDAAPGSVRSYVIGFALSLVLTLTAYILVSERLAEGWALIYALAALAVLQLSVQLIYFLHLGRESKPRWNLHLLVFAVGVVGILVFGSLWIMQNLSYNQHAHPSDTEIIRDEGYKP